MDHGQTMKMYYWYTYICKQAKDQIQTKSRMKDQNSHDIGYNMHKDNANNYSNNFNVDKNKINIPDNSKINCSDNSIIPIIAIDEQHFHRTSSKNINNFDDIEKNRKFTIFEKKSKNEKRIIFPPIYPQDENIFFPLNQGIFSFMSNEF